MNTPTPVSTAVPTPKVPGTPVESPEEVYLLYYRHGMNPQCVKGFKHAGGLKSAIIRAQKHCLLMNYRYIFVRPLICNLEDEEQSRENNSI